jgi:hypothetical protein
MSNNNNTRLNNKKSQAMTTASIRTASLVGITINATVLYVLKDIKESNCLCSDDWRHTFSYYYAMVLIGLNTIVFVLGSKQMLQKVMPLMHLLNLINMTSIVTYLHKLADENCDCERSSVQRFMRYIYYIIAFMYVVSIVFAIFFMASLMMQK